MALALDGSVHGNSGSSNSLPVSLSTSNGNVVIVVCVTTNGGPVTGVSGSTMGAFTLRKAQGGPNFIETWYKKSTSALSSETITVSTTSSSFITVDAFGISGADTTTIFDSNVSLPNAPGGANHVVVSTTNANDFIFAAYRFNSTPSPTEGTGFTKISGANFQLVEYKIVSATQSSLDIGIGTGDGDENNGIGDAIIQATGGGGFFGRYYYVMGARAINV